MKPRTTLIVFTITIGLILSSGLIFWGRGTFHHAMMIFEPGLWIGIPSLVLAVILKLVRRRWNNPALAWARTILFCIFLLIALQIPSLYFGRQLQRVYLSETQQYLIGLTSTIEDYKKKKGHYPETFAQLKLEAYEMPYLFKVSRITLAEFDNNFQVIISDPKEFGIYGFIYWSKKHLWEYFVN